MRACRLALILFLAGIESAALGADDSLISSYCNPLEVHQADPAVLKTENGRYRYYMSGTGRWRHVSNDLVNWRRDGAWISLTVGGHSVDGVWGTEVVEKDGKFYLFFSARLDGSSTRTINLAWADAPDEEFQPLAYPLWSDGDGWIGPHVFTEDDGQCYLYATNDQKDEHDGKARIYVARLTDDMTALDSPLVFLAEPSQPWENKWQEGVNCVKHNGTYYMSWSSRVYTSDMYSVGYATASDPMGPFTKSPYNPILCQEAADPIYYGHTGPGSHGMAASPDGKELFIVYHTHRTSALGGPRQPNIDRVRFVDDGANPDRMVIEDGPSRTPKAWPSGSPFAAAAQNDQFEGSDVDPDIWTNVWGEAGGDHEVNNGDLIITCDDGQVAGDQSDGQNVFLQFAPPGSWRITAKVNFDAQENHEQAFLTVWQDSNNYVMLKTSYNDGLKFESAREENESYTSEATTNTIGSDVYLQIRKSFEKRYRCFVSADGESWTQVGSSIFIDLYDIKVGLGAWKPGSSRATVKAKFDFFHIERTQQYETPRDYVRAGVSGGDGHSWATAWNIAEARGDLANPGEDDESDIGAVVWVAQGNHDLSADGALNPKSLQKWYGGFPDTGDPDWEDRDPDRYATLIDAVGAQEHVIRQRGVHNVLFDGLTITGGAADGADNDARGGGVLCAEDEDAGADSTRYNRFANCRIAGNRADDDGGGLYCDATGPCLTLEDCAISSNTAGDDGGGIAVLGSDGPATTTIEIVACAISDNVSGDIGGEAWLKRTIASVAACVFDGNWSADNCGGLLIANYNSAAAVTNTVFSNNCSTYSAGLSTYGGAKVDVVNCAFTGNESASGAGAGVCLGGGASGSNVVNDIFSDNLGAAAIHLYSSSGTRPDAVYNNLFHGAAAVYNIDGSVHTLAGLNGTVYAGDNISSNPLFEAGSAYKLTGCSAAIDAATDSLVGITLPSADIEGTTRPQDGDGLGGAQYDIGAYEFTPTPASDINRWVTY